GDPNIVGKVIRVNGAPCEVVGVTARGYRGLSQGGFYPATDVTLPLSSQPTVMPSWSTGPSAGASMFTSNLFWVRVLARVPTTFREIDRAVLDVFRREYLRLPGVEPAALDGLRVRRLPGARGLDAIRSDIERPLQFLAGVAAIVLVLACLNLSGLMLARGVARQRELSVRHALGAGRVRAVRLLMAESLLLSGIGGLLGVLVAIWTAPLVSSMVTTGLDAVSTPGVGWPLVATAGSVSALAAVLSGVIPALRLSGQQVSHLSQRSTTGGTRHAAGRMLIALQIAVSVPLLVGAGLLLRTIHNLTSAELGFDPQGLVIFRVEPGLDARGMDADPVAVYDRVLERVRRMPGVTSATLVENVLISGWSSSSDVRVGGNEVDMSMNAIGPDFFETMGIRIVAGRPISSADRAGAPAAVVINETAARTYFPGALPIGRRFTVGRQEVEIVGVASSTRYRSLRTAPLPSFYDSYAQRTLESFPRLARILRSGTPRAMHVVLRASVPPRALVAAIPSAVSEVAPDLPVREIRTQADQIEQSIARERLLSRLLLIFGGFAVLLACIGLHGVTSYSVARRTSEIGIRVALGARRTQVIWLILRQVLVVALAGVALGVPIALLAGPVVASMLFGLAPRDAFTIVLAAAIMLSVALAAGWLPARRAARLPVVAALRLD
ncbi:MAG TPA: FtsX-like permease family protein, partial [Vicinamibacterales bacterium]|nr:FtsX-like permease family protein [Vicinamibacterales bacterium]